MYKAWQIALKDLRISFGDRNLLLIMIAAPLVLVSIIGVTFGRASSGAPLQNIPVAVVNLDEGALLFEGDEDGLNYGAILTGLLVDGTFDGDFGTGTGGTETTAFECPTVAESGAGMSNLGTLINGTIFATEAEALAAVEAGTFSAAVIIPPAFSTNLRISPTDVSITPTTIGIYTDPRAPIAGQIVATVVDRMSTQFAAGNVTLAALLESLPENPLQTAAIVASPAFAEGIACAFSDAGADISLQRQTPTDDGTANSNFVAVIGAAQAIFFALFVANGMAGTIISERRDWTLQRMLTTPTPAVMVLLGKIMSVFVVILAQMIVLFVGLAIIAPIISGRPGFIWGDNLPALAAALVASAFATAGIGSITMSVAKNEEQGSTIGSVVAIFMALFGGAFGFSFNTALNNLSVVYWGQTAFTKLAAGNSDILGNLIALMLFGVISFAIAFVLFRSKIADR